MKNEVITAALKHVTLFVSAITQDINMELSPEMLCLYFLIITFCESKNRTVICR